ncbi:MAG: MFS transporter [Paracoccaceae bacterium]
MKPTRLPLFLIAFLVGSDEFLLGPILTPIGTDLGVPPERVALFVGAYALPLAFLAPVLGRLSDRHGRRRVLVPSMFLFALGSLATALAGSFEVALATRVITGLGAAGMLPVAFAIAADSDDHGSAAIAAVQSGLTLGIIASPAYGAWITANLGWQAAFATLTAATFITIPWALRLPKGTGNRVSGLGIRTSLRTPGALPGILAMGLGLGGAVGIFALTGERLRDLTATGTEGIGLVLAGFGVLTLLGNLAMPWLERAVRSRLLLVSLCFGGVAAGIVVLFGFEPGLAVSLVALAAWAVLGGAGAPALQAHIAGLSAESRGLLMALASSALNLGTAIWSAVASDLFAIGPSWIAMQAVMTIGMAIFLLNAPGRRQRVGETTDLSGASG